MARRSRGSLSLASDLRGAGEGDELPTKVWRDDLEQVPASTRRAAAYALRLLQASRESFDTVVGNEEGTAAAWKIVAPLLTPKALGAVPTGEDSETDRYHYQVRILKHLPPHLLPRLTSVDGDAPTHPSVRALVQLLDLNAAEAAVLDYLEKRPTVAGFLSFLQSCGSMESLDNFARLVAALNVDATALRDAILPKSTLRQTRLIESNRHVWNCRSDIDDLVVGGDGLGEILMAAPGTAEELANLLIEPAPVPVLSLADFPHQRAAGARLTRVLSEAARTRASGVNALLYGPSGTGKTEFAHALARAAGLTLYRVRTADEDGDGLNRSGRFTAFLIAQRVLAARPDALILFDEAEDVFGDEDSGLLRLFGGGRRRGREKGWTNRLLEHNVVPAIWVTNDVETMDEAFLRRFLLPVEFPIPPRSVRRRIADTHLDEFALPDTVLDELAGDDRLAPAQFGAARRLLELHGKGTRGDAAEPVIREGVAAIRRLLHGSGLPVARRSPTAFDVAFVNIGGGISAGSLMIALARLGRGRLCFYGPPGTGKTEFAHALADHLGRELVAKQASDLASKYVGETESNIAGLFRSIDPERSILLLDEVDTFLRDRRQAERSWEVSQVNELLQQLERYQGIFIAATNLMGGLDPAALRRFDFKLQFRPLNAAQRLALFAREALGDIELAANLPAALREPLLKLDALTAGDFANVCRQRELLGEDLTPADFIRRLAQECRWKAAVAA